MDIQIPEQWQSLQSDVATPQHNTQLLQLPNELQGLIAQALAQNTDFSVAMQRLQMSAADLQIAQGQLLPDVSAASGWSYNERFNDNDKRIDSKSLSHKLRVAWELDVWGRLAEQENAASADWQAVQADYQDAQQSLVAQVIQAYLDLTLNTELSALFAANFANQQKRVSTMLNRVDLGLAKPVDLYLAKTSLHNIETQLSTQKSRVNAARSRLNILLGRYPTSPLKLNFEPVQIADFSLSINPANVLQSRPDIRAAEYRVASAFNQWKSSSKGYLPSFRLAADISSSESSLRDLFNWQSWLARLAADISMPIFDADRLENIHLKNASKEQIAWLNYQKRILTAMKEIESSVYAEYELNERKSAIFQSTNAIQAAEQLLLAQYEQGITNSSSVFNIQSRRINSQADLVRVNHAILSNRVTLTLALGEHFNFEVKANETY
ncbi:outer membrane transport protein [Catenovulum agarivorans DS-2]|uniref:Outer membrane transport protein n=2 Tax=Catenovulum agarivorans TaxID=1172192 RepID=W7QPF2_9ALTE|nr:outer membrane transport protein [Catenovulum agarivorans DS-2]